MSIKVQKLKKKNIDSVVNIKSKLAQLTTLKNNIHCFNDEGIDEDYPMFYSKNTYSDVNEEQSPVGLRMLDVNNNHIGIQFGCEMFSLIFYAEKSCRSIIVIDSYKKLLGLNKRLTSAQKKKIILISGISSNENALNNIFDFAIINFSINPVMKNKDYLYILRFAHNLLKYKGRLYFAVDNIYNYNNFIFLLSNFNLSYNLKSYKNMLNISGFGDLKEYASFPNKDYPFRIIPIDKDTQYIQTIYHKKNKSVIDKIIIRLKLIADKVLFGIFKLYRLSPSFIFISKTNK